jgi:hypothetical protein
LGLGLGLRVRVRVRVRVVRFRVVRVRVVRVRVVRVKVVSSYQSTLGFCYDHLLDYEIYDGKLKKETAKIADSTIADYYSSTKLSILNIHSATSLLNSLCNLYGMIARKPQPESAMASLTSGETIPVEELEVGDIIIIAPGTAIPVDGIVREGSSEVDESLVSNGDIIVLKVPGNPVSAGTWNTPYGNELKVETVTRVFYGLKVANSELLRGKYEDILKRKDNINTISTLFLNIHDKCRFFFEKDTSRFPLVKMVDQDPERVKYRQLLLDILQSIICSLVAVSNYGTVSNYGNDTFAAHDFVVICKTLKAIIEHDKWIENPMLDKVFRGRCRRSILHQSPFCGTINQDN